MTQEAIDIQQNWIRHCPDNREIQTKDGVIKVPRNTLKNLFHAMTRSPQLRGVFSFDEWRQTVVVARTPPWEGDYRKIPRGLCDTDYLALRVYLESIEGFSCSFPKEAVADMIERTARMCAFNDVKEYFSGLVWDKRPRLDTWLQSYLHAEITEANRFMGSKWLISAVARALEPGCKVDHMLVLEGEQGVGKSTVFKILFDPFYLEGMPEADDAQAAYKIQGFLCVEASELSALSRGDLRAAKSFITSREDVFRAPYGRNFIRAPRRCVFAGTTNERDYLRDTTGARRFWCVRTAAAKYFRLGDLAMDKDQLWAEAKFRYDAGEKWWPVTESEIRMLAEVASERLEDNPFVPQLQAWLSNPMTETPITLVDALATLKIESRFVTKPTQMAVVAALKTLGFERLPRRESTPDGQRVSLYDRKEKKR